MSTPLIYSNSWIGGRVEKAISSPPPPSRKVVNGENRAIRITVCRFWKQLEERTSAWEGVLLEQANDGIGFFNRKRRTCRLGSVLCGVFPKPSLRQTGFSAAHG